MNALTLLAQAVSSSDSGTGIALFGGLGIVLLLLGLIATIFWIWMLIDCLTSNLPSTEKLIWAVVIIFLHLLGAILYFFLGRRGARGTA